MIIRICVLVLSITALMFAGCSQSFYQQGRHLAEEGQHEQAVDLYRQEVAAHPDRYECWRELGVSYYELGRYDDARMALLKSLEIEARPRTHLYLGLTYEKLSEWDKALLAYDASLEADPPERLRRKIEARRDRIGRLELINRMLASEQQIQTDTIPANTIAVYDFDGSQLPRELSPLAIGLSEFTALSLAKVKSLEVVERIQLEILLDELRLVEAGLVDPTTAPRVGRLLGSRRVVTGWVENPHETDLRLGSTIINTVDSSEVFPDTEEGQLKKIIQLQIAFVYEILRELGVEPTEEERREIETVPTQSYDAFMAYCRGLQYKRDGEFEQAVEQFDEAVALDQEFSEAVTQAEETTELAEQTDFEDVVRTETIGGASDLETALSNVVETTGTMPSATEEESTSTNSETQQPPTVPTTTVHVEGSFDGK